ncbi:MAG: ATP-binding cassette domain-containing protein, partial [Proteobacteria bacterium]|nr:ATP-binding cassette domain-containing protein [Pseudomonadota bacterium]NIS71238.1 ATP-binding cassette domain-containing protein [Pseudomonadota bacterium]
MSILELKGITYFYNGKKVLDIPALTIEKGRMYGVVGPNGSGKTTLLSIMSLMLRPASGEVYFEGRRIRHDSKSFVIARGFMTMTLQNPYLFNTSVAKNAAYGLR